MSTFHLVVALCLGLPLLANGSPKECMTTVEGYTWEYDTIMDEAILEVDTVDLCYNACAEDTECQGYTWTNGVVVPTCYKFRHQLLGYHECVACTSGVISQSVDGACSAEYDDILDVGPADNVEECIEFCLKTDGCEAYTWWGNTSLFINTCFLYVSCEHQGECEGCVSGRINCIITPPDQCVNYMVLDDAARSVNNGGCGYNGGDECYCDQIDSSITVSPDWQGPGLYRIMSSAGSRLPESKPGFGHCGTAVPGWLRGEHPQDIYAEKNMTVCFHAGGDCGWKADITVTNCNGYYVYLLPDTPLCNSRYCVTH